MKERRYNKYDAEECDMCNEIEDSCDYHEGLHDGYVLALDMVMKTLEEKFA